jgi:hypothetical protein
LCQYRKDFSKADEMSRKKKIVSRGEVTDGAKVYNSAKKPDAEALIMRNGVYLDVCFRSKG